MRPIVGGSGREREDVGRVGKRSEFRLRAVNHLGLPQKERAGSNLQGTSGGRRWI